MTRTALLALAALALATVPAQSHSRARAEVACAATDANLAYDCTVRITDMASGQPLEGLAVEVKADMPSMPMAHNIPPVEAEATDEPGVYAFPITLDMFGNWAFSMRLSGAREDLIVEVLGFRAGDAHAGAPGSAEEFDHSQCPSTRGDGGHDHGHGGGHSHD